MAPVVQLARLVWSGPLFTAESWSCSLHMHNAGSAVPMPAAAYAPAIKAWMIRSGSNLSLAAKLQEVKFNRIDPLTGRYAGPVSNNFLVEPVVAGIRPSGPGQLSLALTTATALPRGRAHAGRFYPPTGNPQSTTSPFTTVDGATGQISVTAAEAMGDSAALLVTELNAVDPAYKAVVFSKAGQIVEAITHIRVGLVYDTMRSRRSRLAEAHLSASPV